MKRQMKGDQRCTSDRPSILSETKFAQQGCYATKLRGERFKKTERAVFFIKKTAIPCEIAAFIPK